MAKRLASCAFLVVILSGCGGTTVLLPSVPATSQPQSTTASGGTWSGTVSHERTTHKVVTGTDTRETTDDSYAAHVQVTSQALGLDRWKLTGQGNVESSHSSVSDFTIANCANHFDDEASGSAAVVVPDGGIEIDGSHYNIRVEIPGLTGSETSIRQTCPAQAPDTHEWSVPKYTVLQSGTMTDPNVISGTETDDSGAVTTWELHRTP